MKWGWECASKFWLPGRCQLTVNRGPLYNSTGRHDYRANENTGSSTPAIADDRDERRGKNTAKGQNGRHDTQETSSRFVEIWSRMSISLGHHVNR